MTFDPTCPECGRGSHRCVTCDAPTAHGDLQCVDHAGVVDPPAWALGAPMGSEAG